MPCFSKGETAIIELESRFNPNVKLDADLFAFSQK